MSTILEFRWTVSRGRETYGYNICSLYVDGRKVAACNGGGYDMKGTALGNWLAKAYADRLRELTPEDMPSNSHWEPERARVCAGQCGEAWHARLIEAITTDQPHPEQVKLPEDCWTCPTCGGDTTASRYGRRVDDGRYFYGLTFHDPNYDPSKAIIGQDCTYRTLGEGGATGKTVGEAEAEGRSFGLERIQAAYKASSKHATERHTVPSIDGACGMSSVEAIAKAIGLTFEYVPTRKRHDSVYIVHDARELATV